VTPSEPAITLEINRPGNPPSKCTLTGGVIVGGRAAGCDLVLDDKYVSSRHFRLDWEGDRFRFTDLGSSNGSWINGQPVASTYLKEGDAINVGETAIVVRRIVAEHPIDIDAELEQLGGGFLSDLAPKAKGGKKDRFPDLAAAEQKVLFEQVFRRITREIEAIRRYKEVLADALEPSEIPLEKSVEIKAARQYIEESLRAIEGTLKSLDRDHRRLKALHAAAAMVNRVTDLKERLNAILDMAIEIMEADCGFLMLYDEKTNKIDVALHRGMAIFDDLSTEVDTLVAEAPTPSLSIAREVLRTRTLTVVTDLQRGSQFDSSKSVMAQGILAVLCAPMVFDDELIGLIYVDFRDAEKLARRMIGAGDRELFEALASLAATAIQNAKFFRNIRLEVERRSNLQRYLSPELVDQIIRLNRPINLEPIRRRATVLFCDIRNFTSFAEGTEPERLIRQLNFYFLLMFKAISEENGSLDKFLGDGLMAFFGPLLELENSEVAAVRAAIKMQRSMAEAEAFWQRRGWRAFRIGIGINAGEVVAGNLGTPERLEYTVIGDAVNVASRLSGIATAGQILITQGVAERLPEEEFEVHPLEPTLLKGKSQKIALYEVKY